jgi:hypothetical protein
VVAKIWPVASHAKNEALGIDSFGIILLTNKNIST